MPKVKKTKKKSTDIRKVPLVFGKSCFNKNLIASNGFQAGDLKPQYLKKYTALLVKYGRRLTIQPTGNPGITLTLAAK
jgi:hypothetical protein